MLKQAKHFYTAEEYLALEETADCKSEFYGGEIFAMAGGSRNHSLIDGNIYFELRLALQNKSCEAYGSDMRLLVERIGLHAYPAVMVICGRVEFVPGRNDTVTNPVVIVEVLSPSTRQYDRVKKFAFY